MNLKFKIAVNTLTQIIGRGFSAGTNLLITILVVRQFNVGGYGEFAKIMAYISLFYLVADFGFNAVVLKQTKEDEKEIENSFANLLGLRIISAVFLIFLAIAILSFLPYNLRLDQGFSPLAKLGIIFASLTILTQAILTTSNMLFQKNLRYDLSLLATSLGSVMTFSLVLAFTLLRAPLLTIILSYVAGGACTAATSLILARRFLTRIHLEFNFSWWRRIFWQTLPLGLTLVFNLVYFRSDMILLSLLRANFEVGIYGFAYKFFEFALAIPTFFMNSIYPVLLWRVKDGGEKLANFVKKISFLLLLISLITTAGIEVFAPLLTLVRPDVAPSILALRILVISLPFFFLSSLFMWVLISLGQQKLLVLIYSLSMLLNILLNLIFIPRYGYLAAAITTGFSELVVLIFSLAFTWSFLSRPLSIPEPPKAKISP